MSGSPAPGSPRNPETVSTESEAFSRLPQAAGGIGHRVLEWSRRGVRLVVPGLVLGLTGLMAVVVAWLGDERVSVRTIPIIALGVLLSSTIALVRRFDDRLRSNASRAADIEYWSRRDPTTGVLNRSGLVSVTRRVLRGEVDTSLVAVIVIELDRLRSVAESLGYDTVDQVRSTMVDRLVEVAEATTAEGWAIGSLRIDQFAITITSLPTPADLERLALGIIRSLGAPVSVGAGRTLDLSACIGIAHWLGGAVPAPGQDTPTAGELFGDAELALAEAKESVVASHAFYHRELGELAKRRVEMEHELGQAIRDGQIMVHYQPVVDHTSSSVILVEALMRWQHPTRGMVHPADFLPVAVDSGLIVRLGEVVMERACTQAVAWSGRIGRQVAVSINLESRQVHDLALVGSVESVLERSGLSPQHLFLEVAEDQLDGLDRSSRATLDRLRNLGVGIIIDDFGANQAALGALRSQRSVSFVKIDRAFVESVASDPVDYKVVSAIVALANSAGVSVMASGVENAAQAGVLAQLGIELQQGFHFCRPGPADEIGHYLGIPDRTPAMEASKIATQPV